MQEACSVVILVILHACPRASSLPSQKKITGDFVFIFFEAQRRTENIHHTIYAAANSRDRTGCRRTENIHPTIYTAANSGDRTGCRSCCRCRCCYCCCLLLSHSLIALIKSVVIRQAPVTLKRKKCHKEQTNQIKSDTPMIAGASTCTIDPLSKERELHKKVTLKITGKQEIRELLYWR